MTCKKPIIEVKPTVLAFKIPVSSQWAKSATVKVTQKVGGYEDLSWSVAWDKTLEWLKIIMAHNQGQGNGRFKIEVLAKNFPVGEYNSIVIVKSNAENGEVPILVHLDIIGKL